MRVKIEGMSCEHCVETVTRVLAAVPGVDEVSAVDLARGEALLEGDPDGDVVVEAIEEQGYGAMVET